MIAVVTLLTIVLALAGLFLYYANKNKQKKRDLYPKQAKVISELLDKLKTYRIELLMSLKGTGKTVRSLTLLEVGQHLDNEGELSKEEYDDHKIFFTDTANALSEFTEYIHSDLLPKDILNELKDFHNTKYTEASPTNGAYFVIGKNQHLIPDEKLVEGNGEAFESWLTFKERASNLEYIINQWLKENEKTGDARIYNTSTTSLANQHH